jgi:hypothetical protein
MMRGGGRRPTTFGISGHPEFAHERIPAFNVREAAVM